MTLQPDNFQCLDLKCPIQYVVEILDSKWSIMILRELFAQARRTHELQAALVGISSKTLTQNLRKLEAHGLVTRTVFPEVPPRVEYTMTAKGRELQPLMAALHQVGSQWLEQDPCACALTQGLP